MLLQKIYRCKNSPICISTLIQGYGISIFTWFMFVNFVSFTGTTSTFDLHRFSDQYNRSVKKYIHSTMLSAEKPRHKPEIRVKI